MSEPEYPTWHVVQVACTTCPTGGLVAVHPAWVKRARCAACIHAGIPYTGELVEVPVREPVVRVARTEMPAKPVRLTRADVTLPEPEWTSRQPWPVDVEIPGPILALRKLAAECGWTPAVQYARGWKFGVGVRTNLTHSVALRLRHEDAGLYAVVTYEAKAEDKPSWKVDKVWVSGSALPAYGGLGVTALKAFLTVVPGLTPDRARAWVEAERVDALVKAAEKKAEDERKKAEGVAPKRKAKEGAS